MIVCQAKNADFLDGEGSDSDVGWLNEWLCQPYICINHILHHWAFRWYKFCDVHKLFSTHHTLQSELLRPFTTKMKLSSSSTDLSDPKHFFEILISNLNFFFFILDISCECSNEQVLPVLVTPDFKSGLLYEYDSQSLLYAEKELLKLGPGWIGKFILLHETLWSFIHYIHTAIEYD